MPRAPDVGSGKLLAIIGLATVLLANRAMAESFVDVVKGRGYLTCGVGTGTPGFMQTDREGKWTRLAIDVCRAVSATILGDAGRAKFVPLDPIHHLSALQSGAVDLLTSNSAFTLARDAGLGIDFAGIYYYDGQGFMVPRKTRIRHFKELHRATICLQPGTTIESSLADHFRANNLTFRPLAIARSEDMRAAYLAGRCDAVTADFSTLHAMLAINPQQTDEHLILSQSIAKTPYSPAVRHGDTHFANVVRWALYAMIYAEELGITSDNVDEMLKRDNPAIRRMLGDTPGIGKALGVSDKWVYDVIKQVGNYGESYERNLGNGSPLKISRSLNAQWTKGGILYAPPIR